MDRHRQSRKRHSRKGLDPVAVVVLVVAMLTLIVAVLAWRFPVTQDLVVRVVVSAPAQPTLRPSSGFDADAAASGRNAAYAPDRASACR